MTPGIRWTIGDVAPRGFTALRLSVWGAFGVFGPEARYAVVVNGVRPEEAAARAGPLPPGVAFVAAHGLAPLLRARLDAGMAEGVDWKFAPPRIFPDRPELSLDNDCILWAMPAAIRRWLEGPPSAVLAEDVRPAFGRFAGECGTAPRNTGIRGLPPGFDVAAALGAVLARSPGGLTVEARVGAPDAGRLATPRCELRVR